MAHLKCTQCGNTFETSSLTSYGQASLTGVKMGSGVIVLKWPLVTRVLAECPNCGKKCWLKVLRHRHFQSPSPAIQPANSQNQKTSEI